MPILIKVGPTSRTGFAYHFQQLINSKIQNFELIKEGVTKTGIKLVCGRRPHCIARFHLPIRGSKLRIEHQLNKYELLGDEDEIRDIKNYGQLYHNHSDKCKGWSLLLFLIFTPT